jgi:hypothetical protein
MPGVRIVMFGALLWNRKRVEVFDDFERQVLEHLRDADWIDALFRPVRNRLADFRD